MKRKLETLKMKEVLLITIFFQQKNFSNLGCGVYLADEKKPSNISGGFAWQFNDIFNKLDKPGNTFEKSSNFFYVGYTIGAK